MLRRALRAVGLLGVAREVRERAIAARAWRRNAALRRAGAPDGWPLPPGLLVHRVGGTPELRWYLDSGRLAASSIEESLRRHGAQIATAAAVLDFGCGCGRLLRHWAKLPARLHGCDYNAQLIAWCRRHLRFTEFQTNALAPPLPYPDESFDLITALSVFTHLSADLQLPWLRELRRIIRPGGYLLLSLHGRRYLPDLTPEERDRFERGDLVVREGEAAGTNRCGAYHPERYVRERLADGFVLLEHQPEGARGNPHQDLVLLRRG